MMIDAVNNAKVFPWKYSNSNMHTQEESQLSRDEWIEVYHKLKRESTYKFLYTDIDAYTRKIHEMLRQDFRYPREFIKKSEHNNYLDNLKVNFLKISSDLNLLDLSSLSLCIDYALDNLLNTLKTIFIGFTNAVSIIREEQFSNQSKYFSLERCQQCQGNFQKIKIESLKTSVTLCQGKPSTAQMNRLNSQLEDLGVSYEDVQLSLMIDEVLQTKQTVLNAKNHKMTSAIYEQISEYLENIPQETFNLSKEEENSERNRMASFNNISSQIEKGFTDMLKKPLRKLITRLYYYFRHQNRTKNLCDGETQTLLMKDEETIKNMQKSYDKLKKQFESLKSLKREAEKDMIKMMDLRQKNEIKISELTISNTFLEEKCSTLYQDVMRAKRQLQDMQKSKKQMGQSLIKDYTSEKATYQKMIRELENKVEISTEEINRLRRRTLGSMISREIQVNLRESIIENEAQTSPYGQITEDDHFIRASNNRNSSFAYMRSHKKQNSNGLYMQTASEEENFISHVSHGQQQWPRTAKSSLWEQNFEASQKLRGSKKSSAKNSQKRLTKEERDEIISDQQEKNDKNDHNMPNVSILRPGSKRILEKKSSFQSPIQRSSKKSIRKSSQNQNQFFKIISWSRQGHRSPKKNSTSSRMFIPIPHCSPYIGPQLSGEENWFDSLEGQKTRKVIEEVNKVIISNEEPEQVEIISKICLEYQQLKSKGLIEKIKGAISELPNQNLAAQTERLQTKSQLTKEPKEGSFQLQPFCSQISPKITIPAVDHKIKQQNRTSILLLNLPQSNMIEIGFKFVRRHIFLLFQAEEWMSKYEKGEHIWKILERSIMVDSKFMPQCTKISSFIVKLEEKDPQLHRQCCQLLCWPLQYLKKISNKQTADLPSANGIRKYSHRKNLSGTNFERKKDKKLSTSEIWNIFLKLFRFHHVIHGKCSHLQQFLTLIGFKNSA